MTSAPWSLGWISTAPEPPLPPPVRLQLSRKAGFSLQALSQATNGRPAVRVTRPGKWGNPHVPLRTWYHGGMPALGLPAFDAVTAADADAEGVRIAVALHRLEVHQRLADPERGPPFRAELARLRGKNLACWCRPAAPCHADTYLDVANRPICEEVTFAAGGARVPNTAGVRRPVRSEAAGGGDSVRAKG